VRPPIVALTSAIDPVGERILREGGCELRVAPDLDPSTLLATCADADARAAMKEAGGDG
jgi:hypothetical protein